MAVTTIYRISEQVYSLLSGGDPKAASSISMGELKIAIGQTLNAMLKTEYFSVNLKMGEVIPNGSVLCSYEGIEVFTSNGKSQCTLPIKPLKLPRNMGVWGIYPRYTLSGNYEYDNEFIPLQMGQSALIKSQPLFNDLLGMVGYECIGDRITFTKDIKTLFPDVVLAMRLAVMDISQYDDYTPLPILPEMEMQVIQEVYKLFMTQPTASKVVDSTVDEAQGIPVNQQKQTS